MGGPVAPAPDADPMQIIQQHQLQRLQKDYTKDENPYGSPQNHPGFLGKLAHGLNVATGGINRRTDEEQGIEKELSGTVGDVAANREKNATSGHLEAETPEVAPNAESERNARDVGTATAQQALDMGPSLIVGHAHAVNQAIAAGRNPADDPIVQQYEDAIQSTQRAQASKAFQHVAGTAGGKDMYANYDPNKGVYTDLQGNVLTDFKPKDKAMQGALGQYAPVRLLTSLMQTAYRDNPALLPVLKPLMSKIMAQYGGEGAAETMAAIPAGQPENSEGAPIGLSMPEAPTGATRSRGQFAESVLPSMEDAKTEIANLGDQLGPMAGRYNELATSKIGAYGPEFTGLQTTLHNVATAWMRLHANSDAARQDFINQLRAAQSPENLVAALDSIEKQAKDYVNQGKGRSAKNAGGGNAPKVLKFNPSTGRLE